MFCVNTFNFMTGVVRVWNVCSAKELYVQSNSLVSKASVENGLGITQILLNHQKKALAIVTAEHNIIFHNLETFACIKQVKKMLTSKKLWLEACELSLILIFLKLFQLVGFSDEILDVVLLGKDDSHMAVATNSSNVILYRISDMACFLLGGHGNLVLGLASTKANPRLLASCSKVCMLNL